VKRLKNFGITPATIVCLILLSPVSAQAAMLSCTVVEAYMLDDKGVMVASTYSKAAKDTPAVVDTATGAVNHPLFGNTSYPNRILVDQGSTQSAFKVVALSPEGARPEFGVASFRNMTVFEIDTWRECPLKTFWAFEGEHFGSGYCQ
jgi:hypothetical protein